MAIINGTAGNDDLLAPGSNDELLGLEGSDTLDGVLTGKGNNTLRGGAGNDELFAYTEDKLFGDEGDDDLYSDGKGKNLLDGGEGNDEIFPDRDDTVNGGLGDDIIFAGRGGNSFTGGLGKDIFWIANVEAPENPNIIADFNIIEDTIRVDLEDVESVDNLEFKQDEEKNRTIINALGGQLAIIEGVTPDQLDDINVVTDKDAPSNPGVGIKDLENGTIEIIFNGTKLNFTVDTINANTTVNELVVFEYEDGTTPDLQQLLSGGKAQVISSIVTNQPNGFNASDIARILEFSSGKFGFALIKNGTGDDVKNGQSKEIVYSTSDNFISNISANGFEFNIEGFNIKVATTSEQPAIGSGLQTGNEGELLDFRKQGELTGVDKVEVTFSMFREAAFDNQVVFYEVQDADGRIGDSLLDPNSTLATDYLQAALDNLVIGDDGNVIKLEVENQGQASVTTEVDTGSIFAPMIIVDGNLEDLQDANTSNDPTVYFPFIGANSDSSDHIRLLGNNVFGFEDLASNESDFDYQDIIVQIQVNAQQTIAV